MLLSSRRVWRSVAVASTMMESSGFNSGDDIRAGAREKQEVRSSGLAGVCRPEKKTAFLTDGCVSPGKPRGAVAMDRVSVCVWELAAARGTAACVAEGQRRSMRALAFVQRGARM
jgi:hypothetical protein